VRLLEVIRHPLHESTFAGRGVLAEALCGVVLVDGDGKPRCTLDRSRFLLTVSAAYGYARYARREATRLGDEPRMISPPSRYNKVG
jgi:hypothetical protein